MQKNNYDVIIIGGGASGLMAAAVAGESGQSVLLLEKNAELGKKLSITGGGRCNILNAEEDERLLLANYGEADKFLFSAFSQYGMQDTYDYFESRGLKLKVEGRKRAFPASESAADVVRLLTDEMKKYAVDVQANCKVESLYAVDGKIEYVQVDSQRLQAKRYVLATGGTSKPETGSTGDGFKWLKSMGHSVNEPTPNVTPLATKESWPADVSGIKATAADITFYVGDKKKFKSSGDILFTHFGISGPTVLNSASKVADLLKQGAVTATIDCYPKTDQKQLDAQVIDILHQHKSKQLRNTLRYIAPDGLGRALESLLSPAELSIKNSELPKNIRLKMVKLLKALPLTIDKLMGFEKAVVADGGLDLKDIDTRTMQSKKINNLYITGDLLDINRPTGGYSLQLCWTTGYIAGKN